VQKFRGEFSTLDQRGGGGVPKGGTMSRTQMHDAPAAARRSFLKGATLVGAAAVLSPLESAAQTQVPPRWQPRGVSVNAAAETGRPPAEAPLTAAFTGSDFMVDCFKSLGFDYLPANPGSSFRALQESIVNYGKNQAPEILTCTHEEASIAMAHGYAKIDGRPLINFVHGTVGLQHATMALYNAYCDRVPIYVVGGNRANAEMRRPGVEWMHTAQDAAAISRDFVKWDDYPSSLQHFAESAVRAYKIAMTPPMGPVVLMADGSLQEDPIPEAAALHIPKLPQVALPEGEWGAVAEAARLLVAAERPLLIADRMARTPRGLTRLVELAELVQVAVIDAGGRMNFPTRHPLNQSHRAKAMIAQADLIIGLDVNDFWGDVHSYRDQLHRTSRPILNAGCKTVTISSSDLSFNANYQDFERFPEVDLAIAADAETTLAMLIEAVKRELPHTKKAAYEARGRQLAEAHMRGLDAARTEAAMGWNASPISTARLTAELWAQIKDADWSLVSPDSSVSAWPHRLWTIDKHHQYIGGPGGFGMGYGAPAAVGAALANRHHGRLTVAIQTDGDLMYSPGVLWTAAKHKIPLLFVMHNNRCYFQEIMHLQCMANRHVRDVTTAHIGAEIAHPNIDYAKLAQSLGVQGEGPIYAPADLGPALQRALATVKRGEPALVDVVTQGR
jgi:acetolactate synthase I/II/III large subunit